MPATAAARLSLLTVVRIRRSAPDPPIAMQLPARLPHLDELHDESRALPQAPVLRARRLPLTPSSTGSAVAPAAHPFDSAYNTAAGTSCWRLLLMF